MWGQSTTRSAFEGGLGCAADASWKKDGKRQPPSQASSRDCDDATPARKQGLEGGAGLGETTGSQAVIMCEECQVALLGLAAPDQLGTRDCRKSVSVL